MKQMLKTLYQMGRLDVIRDLKANRVWVMQVYEQFRQGRVAELPTGELMRPLAQTWVAWLDQKEIALRTRRDYGEAWMRLAPPSDATFTDLPSLLVAHRKASLGVRARTFNKDRAAILAFVHAELGDSHWLALACKRVKPLKVANKLPYNPLTVAQAKDLAAALDPHHARTLWAFCLTGMRPEEMFEEHGNRWKVDDQGVYVHGTKSPAAVRVVPRVGLLVKSATGRLAFYRALRKASRRSVSPYDLRRTYAQWLDLARIPQFRQDYYMAHGPKDLNALYKQMRDVGAYLAEDAAALGALVGEPTMLRVVG
jgi:integrase